MHKFKVQLNQLKSSSHKLSRMTKHGCNSDAFILVAARNLYLTVNTLALLMQIGHRAKTGTFTETQIIVHSSRTNTPRICWKTPCVLFPVPSTADPALGAAGVHPSYGVKVTDAVWTSRQ